MIILFYIPCPNKKTAHQIGQSLLKTRLIACYNLFPIESGYWWKKKIIKDKEAVLIVKTLEKLTKKVEKAIKKMHPYTVPCIISLDVETVNGEYGEWVRQTISRGPRIWRGTKQSHR